MLLLRFGSYAGQLIVNETVAVEFYASGLPQTQAGNYTWWHKYVVITGNGMFEKNKRRLVIPNVQEADSGEYRFRVLLRFGAILQFVTFASTQLIVAGQYLLCIQYWLHYSMHCVYSTTSNNTRAPCCNYGNRMVQCRSYLYCQQHLRC